MNETLTRLWSELKAASGTAKLVAAAVVIGVVAIVSVASIFATRPHYKLLYGGLSDKDNAAAQRALAEAGIDFRTSQPPGPYFLYVDEAQEFEAARAVAASGALERPDRGILSTDGAASVFVSSGERAQIVQKRYWQEAEKMLESYDFVTSAEVRTNSPPASPFANEKPRSGSVALNLVPGTTLSRQQKNNIANVVSFYLDVQPERLVITDQSGETLWSPDGSDDESGNETLIDHAESYNANIALRAMELLDAAYGQGRARVRVVSQWDHDRRTRVSKSPGKNVVRESETTKSATPQGSRSVGGAPGTSSNISGGPSGPTAGESTPIATNSESRTVYETGVATEHVLQVGPRLERLYVSLLVDDELEQEIGSEGFSQLVNVVKTAVGYEAQRGDQIEIGMAPFEGLKPVLDEHGQPLAPQELESPGPSPVLRLLLERGVEMIAALAFVIVLLRTLKSEKKSARSEVAAAQAAAASEVVVEPQIDPEELLLHQVDGLVKNDPERVGKILSRWAREDTAKV